MHKQVCEWMREWWHDEEGVTAIEYGLLAALIVVVVAAAIGETGLNLGAMYDIWSFAVISAINGVIP